MRGFAATGPTAPPRHALPLLAACLVAAMLGACGGPGTGPTPPPGGGGNGGQQPTPNTPPQVKSVTVAQSRVEVGTPVTVTAVVEDAETPVANLTYAWTASTGRFCGTGSWPEPNGENAMPCT